jgi:MFS transporter, DHA1 family, multidrug resistance protein
MAEPSSADRRLDVDEVDRELMEAERQASPERYNRRRSDEIERAITASSVSTSSASSVRRAVGMSRLPTQADLERHPTELDRIATARSQHSGTVGRTATSRQSKKALPGFGAGKPYPPPLPAQEEYVVEFDGPDDPMHAQNWPTRKK